MKFLMMKNVTNLRHLESSTLGLTIHVSRSQSQAFIPKKIVTEHGEIIQSSGGSRHVRNQYLLFFFFKLTQQF